MRIEKNVLVARYVKWMAACIIGVNIAGGCTAILALPGTVIGISGDDVFVNAIDDGALVDELAALLTAEG